LIAQRIGGLSRDAEKGRAAIGRTEIGRLRSNQRPKVRREIDAAEKFVGRGGDSKCGGDVSAAWAHAGIDELDKAIVILVALCGVDAQAAGIIRGSAVLHRGGVNDGIGAAEIDADAEAALVSRSLVCGT